MRVIVAHLAEEVHQKKERAIAHARQARTEAAVEALELVLVLDLALNLLPVHAEGRVREHVVKGVGIELVVAERITVLNPAHVLPLDEHVALADGVALGVEFLAERTHDGLGVQLMDVLHAAGKEAPGTRRGVVDSSDDAPFGQRGVVLRENEAGR